MLLNTKSQEKVHNNTFFLKNNKYNLRQKYFKILNSKIRKLCKEEMVRTFGWNGTSTFHNYLSIGINKNSPYITKIIEIVDKYIELEKRYLEKKVELEQIINP